MFLKVNQVEGAARWDLTSEASIAFYKKKEIEKKKKEKEIEDRRKRILQKKKKAKENEVTKSRKRQDDGKNKKIGFLDVEDEFESERGEDEFESQRGEDECHRELSIPQECETEVTNNIHK